MALTPEWKQQVVHALANDLWIRPLVDRLIDYCQPRWCILLNGAGIDNGPGGLNTDLTDYRQTLEWDQREESAPGGPYVPIEYRAQSHVRWPQPVSLDSNVGQPSILFMDGQQPVWTTSYRDPETHCAVFEPLPCDYLITGKPPDTTICRGVFASVNGDLYRFGGFKPKGHYHMAFGQIARYGRTIEQWEWVSAISANILPSTISACVSQSRVYILPEWKNGPLWSYEFPRDALTVNEYQLVDGDTVNENDGFASICATDTTLYVVDNHAIWELPIPVNKKDTLRTSVADQDASVTYTRQLCTSQPTKVLWTKWSDSQLPRPYLEPLSIHQPFYVTATVLQNRYLVVGCRSIFPQTNHTTWSLYYTDLISIMPLTERKWKTLPAPYSNLDAKRVVSLSLHVFAQ